MSRAHKYDETIFVNTIIGDNVTVAFIEFEGEFVVGSAKRMPGDRQKVDIGMDIARGRALQQLGEQLEERGLQAANGSANAA